MRFAISWGPAASFVFYRLPIHSAALVDRAVIRLAETGEGELEWASPYHRLRAGKYDVALAIDFEARTIAVLRIYRGQRSVTGKGGQVARERVAGGKFGKRGDAVDGCQAGAEDGLPEEADDPPDDPLH